MSAFCICDGCGKQASMERGQDSNWHKPRHWYQRSVFERSDRRIGESHGRVVELLVACSRECIDKIHALRTGRGESSNDIVVPF